MSEVPLSGLIPQRVILLSNRYVFIMTTEDWKIKKLPCALGGIELDSAKEFHYYGAKVAIWGGICKVHQSMRRRTRVMLFSGCVGKSRGSDLS